MRKVLFVCERCKKEFPEAVERTLKQIDIGVADGTDGHICSDSYSDICEACYNQFKAIVKAWSLNEDPLAVLATTEHLVDMLRHPNTQPKAIQDLINLHPTQEIPF